MNDPFSALLKDTISQSPAPVQQSSDPFDALTNPPDVKNAVAQTGSQDSDGECQRFVEQMAYGKTGLFPTAVDAWNTYAKNNKAVSGTHGIRPGDLLYFAPDQSNQGAGHTGIYMGNGKFISATDNGVMPYDVSKWQKDTGQQILGYVKPQ